MASNTSSGSSSSSASQQPTATPARKPVELISEILHKNSGNGARNPDAAAGAAEDVRQRDQSRHDAPTSKPEGGRDASDVRPALEIDDDDAGEPRDRQKQRRTLEAIAEETGLSVKQLYNAAVDLGIDGEEPVTVGTLKDHYRQTRQFQQEKDTFDHERETYQTEILTARSQVQGVVDRIVSVVGQETFERVLGDVREESKRRLQTARSQLLEWYPQWADGAVMQRDRERIEKVLGTYGIPKAMVAQIQDATIVKFVMDAINVRERYERLKAGTQEKLPTTQAASRKQHRPSTFDEAKTIAERTGDPKAGIAKLLGG